MNLITSRKIGSQLIMLPVPVVKNGIYIHGVALRLAALSKQSIPSPFCVFYVLMRFSKYDESILNICLTLHASRSHYHFERHTKVEVWYNYILMFLTMD